MSQQPSTKEVQNKTLHALAKRVGLTPEEISSLRLAHLKLAGKHPSITFTSPADNQPKTVELDLDSHRVLVGWLVARPDSISDYLFPGEEEAPLSVPQIQQVVDEIEASSPPPPPPASSPEFNAPPPPEPKDDLTDERMTRPLRPTPPPEPFSPKPASPPPPPGPPEQGGRPTGSVSPFPPSAPEEDLPVGRPAPPPLGSRPVSVPSQPFTPPPANMGAPEEEPEATGRETQGRPRPVGRNAAKVTPKPVRRQGQERVPPKPIRKKDADPTPVVAQRDDSRATPPVSVKPAGSISAEAEDQPKSEAEAPALKDPSLEDTMITPGQKSIGDDTLVSDRNKFKADQESVKSEESAPPVPIPAEPAQPESQAEMTPAQSNQPQTETPETESPPEPEVKTSQPEVSPTPQPGQPDQSPVSVAAKSTPGQPDQPKPPEQTESTVQGSGMARSRLLSLIGGGGIVLLALCGVCVGGGLFAWQGSDSFLAQFGLAPLDVAQDISAEPDLQDETGVNFTTAEPEDSSLFESPISPLATPTLPPTNTPTPLPATNTPTQTATPTTVPTDTPEPTNTPVPTDTPEPTNTPAPVAVATEESEETPTSEESPTPAFKYDAPVLLEPEPDATFIGFNEIELRWQPVDLAPDEQYAVRLFYQYNGQTTFQGASLKEPSWVVPMSLYRQIDPPENRYQWFVVIERLNEDGSGTAISPESEYRSFVWK